MRRDRLRLNRTGTQRPFGRRRTGIGVSPDLSQVTEIVSIDIVTTAHSTVLIGSTPAIVASLHKRRRALAVHVKK